MENVVESFFRQENVARNVMLDEGEILVAGEVRDVLGIAGNKIINRNYPVSFRQQPVDQMRPQKTSASTSNASVEAPIRFGVTPAGRSLDPRTNRVRKTYGRRHPL